MTNTEIMEALKAPFKPEEVMWVIGRKSKDKSKAEAMAYISSRAVMERLDEVVGPDKWEVEYIPADMGTATRTTYKGEETYSIKGFLAKMTLHLPDGDVSRMDGANCTDFSPFKGGITGAMRRVASAFGIGRYLYNLPRQWVPIDQWGNFTERPKLPSWALPEGSVQEEPEPRQSYHREDSYEEHQPQASSTGEVMMPPNTKYAGKPVSSVTDFGYLTWVVNKSRFSEEVKNAAAKVLADQQAAMYDEPA